jgi:hypothetical protein
MKNFPLELAFAIAVGVVLGWLIRDDWQKS